MRYLENFKTEISQPSREEQLIDLISRMLRVPMKPEIYFEARTVVQNFYKNVIVHELNYDPLPNCPECNSNSIWRNFIGPKFYCVHCQLSFWSNKEGAN